MPRWRTCVRSLRRSDRGRANRNCGATAPAAAVALSGGHFVDRDWLHPGTDLGGGRLEKNLVTDTDRYVETVAPLANDPAIQSAIADKITAEVFTHLDVVGITNQAVDALAERGASAVEREDEEQRPLNSR